MYLLDPERGRRRRAMLRDRAMHQLRSAGKSVGGVSRVCLSRLQGRLWKTRIGAGTVSDEMLGERIRSQIGHVVAHAGDVGVAVEDGRVTLSGEVLCSEVRPLLRRVAHVPGVKHVENELEARVPKTRQA
jgi:osmotically-inducible protein OsmY